MNLSVSNIAWDRKDDDAVLNLLEKYGFTGVEVAPTKIVPEAPYDRINEAIAYQRSLRRCFGFVIPSMQSIWYGVTDRIFGTAEERTRLTAYSQKAIRWAEAVGCKNLVFGCPRNRAICEGEDAGPAVPFFRELGEYAKDHGTVLAMEANPPIYHTNYINTTPEAVALIREVDSEGFRLNPMYIEKKSRRLQLLLKPSIYDAVKRRAEGEGVSVNDLINTILEDATK